VVRPLVDKLITIAKKKDPANAIRAINAIVLDKNASRKLMEVLRVRYASRPSGFTRMVPVGARIGDGAEMVNFQLVDAVEAEVVDAKTVKAEKEKKEKKEPKTRSTSSGPAKKTSSPAA
jgi:large subunit ribosomal protein L17